MKRLLVTAALTSALAGCATSATAPAASTAATAKSPYESEILATVDRFLLAIGNHDDEALEEILITEGVSWIQTIKPGEEQPVRPYTNASMMEPDPDADPFIERYWNPTAVRNVDLDRVAVLDQADRAAGRRFGRSMADRQARGAAREAAVGQQRRPCPALGLQIEVG
jgi:hypothetical protein